MKKLAARIKLSWQLLVAGFRCIWREDAAAIYLTPYTEREIAENNEEAYLKRMANSLKYQNNQSAAKLN